MNVGTPLYDRLVVTVEEAKGETKVGSIVVPEVAREKPQRGVVVAVGEECKYVSTGDRIVYGKYSGTELTLDGQSFLILHEKDVLLVCAPDYALDVA